MKIFRFRLRRHADLDARVAQAQRRAGEAAEEARLSQVRHEAVVENVVRPLRRAGERNQFAELVRRSLIEGHGGGA